MAPCRRPASRSAAGSMAGRRSASSTATTAGPVTRRAFGPTMTSPVAPEISTSSCFSKPQLLPANGSASATTFHGPVSAQAIDSARSGSSRTTRERSGTSACRANGLELPPRALAPPAASRASCRRSTSVRGSAPGQRHLAHEAVGRAVEAAARPRRTGSRSPTGRRGRCAPPPPARWRSAAPSPAAGPPGR